MNMWLVPSTITTKSVSAGEYTAPPARRAHDQRDLRDHAGAAHVAHEDLAVEAERDHALLDPRAAAVVDPDHRAADLGGDVHHLDDLLAVHLAERAAEHRGVLAEHRDRPAVDGAGAGDHAVAERAPLLHAEVGGAVPGQGVELDERARVEQHLQPLAGGVAALGVLALGRLGSVSRAGVAPVQVGELARGGVEIGVGVRRRRAGSAAALMPRSLTETGRSPAWQRTSARSRSVGDGCVRPAGTPGAAPVRRSPIALAIGTGTRGSVRAHEPDRPAAGPDAAPRRRWSDRGRSWTWSSAPAPRTPTCWPPPPRAPPTGPCSSPSTRRPGAGGSTRSWVSPPGSGLTVSVLLRPDGRVRRRGSAGCRCWRAGRARHRARASAAAPCRAEVAQRRADRRAGAAQGRRASSPRWPTRTARRWSIGIGLNVAAAPARPAAAPPRSPPRASTSGGRRCWSRC